MGLADFEAAAFLLHFLREDDVFCDVGANLGAYTLLASGLRKARTVAVEPIRATFEALQRNVGLNNIGGLVSARNVAVGASKSRLMFTADLDAMNRVALDEDKHERRLVEVDVLPLDDILERTMPLLLKVDVEGFEPQVLAGATQTLASAGLRAIIIETIGNERHYGYGSDIVHDNLVRNGFSLHAYHPFTRKIERCPRPQEERVSKFNSLYLRDLEFVEKRIASAPTVEVLGSLF
jgi:FkbM family methyltransferase